MLASIVRRTALLGSALATLLMSGACSGPVYSENGTAPDLPGDTASDAAAPSAATAPEAGPFDATQGAAPADASAPPEACAASCEDASILDASMLDASAGDGGPGDGGAVESPATDPGAAALPPEVMALRPAIWLRADLTTLEDGKVAALRDGLDPAHLFTQPQLGMRTSRAEADGALQGQPALAFTGSESYSSNQPADHFRFLHDGSGSEVFHVFRPVGSLVGLKVIAATGPCIGSETKSNAFLEDGVPGVTIRQGSAAVVQQRLAPVSPDEPLIFHASFATARAPSFVMRANSQHAEASADPGLPNVEGSPLRIAGCTDGKNNAAMMWAESLFFDHALARGERVLVDGYLLQRYGIILTQDDAFAATQP